MSTHSIEVCPEPRENLLDQVDYWAGMPLRLLGQFCRNSHDICRVLDLIKLNPLGPGLIDLQHPWVTGINPDSGRWIWEENVIYRSPKDESLKNLHDDRVILVATGKFMASRVRKSATLPELEIGPKRRMPHAINYMHGSSHYSSGIIILNNMRDGFRHLSDPQFRRDVRQFVRCERRELLFLFRDRQYDPRQYAFLSCCMRTCFHWFCNPNGPQARVLWGNLAPFAAANLITGHWADDVYALRQSDGASRVIRPAIPASTYMRSGPYFGNRDHAIWPEKVLAKVNDFRIRLRGKKSGMFFVDRRKVYADQIGARTRRGQSHEYRTTV